MIQDKVAANAELEKQRDEASELAKREAAAAARAREEKSELERALKSAEDDLRAAGQSESNKNEEEREDQAGVRKCSSEHRPEHQCFFELPYPPVATASSSESSYPLDLCANSRSFPPHAAHALHPTLFRNTDVPVEQLTHFNTTTLWPEEMARVIKEMAAENAELRRQRDGASEEAKREAAAAAQVREEKSDVERALKSAQNEMREAGESALCV